MIVMAIRIHLDDILKERNMTSKELCKKVHITEANLSILRSGKAKGVRFSTINKICYYLECDVGDITPYHNFSAYSVGQNKHPRNHSFIFVSPLNRHNTKKNYHNKIRPKPAETPVKSRFFLVVPIIPLSPRKYVVKLRKFI